MENGVNNLRYDVKDLQLFPDHKRPLEWSKIITIDATINISFRKNVKKTFFKLCALVRTWVLWKTVYTNSSSVVYVPNVTIPLVSRPFLHNTLHQYVSSFQLKTKRSQMKTSLKSLQSLLERIKATLDDLSCVSVLFVGLFSAEVMSGILFSFLCTMCGCQAALIIIVCYEKGSDGLQIKAFGLHVQEFSFFKSAFQNCTMWM